MPTTIYDWDPVEDNTAAEYDGAGAVVAEYITEPKLHGDVKGQRRDGETKCFYSDGQGSVTEVTNENNDVIATRSYSAFGEVTESSGAVDVPYHWIGQKGYYAETQTNSYNVRHRVYECANGRWHSFDPVGYFSAESGYLYVHNRPIDVTDPSGLRGFLGGSFTAGSDLSRKGCPGTPPFTVTYSALDVTYCFALLNGGATLSLLPCARALLRHFLNGGGTTFSSEACSTALRRNRWVRDVINGLFTDDLYGSNKCCKNFTSKASAQMGSPCFDPFKGKDEDLAFSIGGIDDAAFSATANIECSAPSGNCCDCTMDISADVTITDTYDFISTLPPTAPRRSAFWCAAVVEHETSGRTVFTAVHSATFSIQRKTTVCDYRQEEP